MHQLFPHLQFENLWKWWKIQIGLDLSINGGANFLYKAFTRVNFSFKSLIPKKSYDLEIYYHIVLSTCYHDFQSNSQKLPGNYWLMNVWWINVFAKPSKLEYYKKHDSTIFDNLTKHFQILKKCHFASYIQGMVKIYKICYWPMISFS